MLRFVSLRQSVTHSHSPSTALLHRAALLHREIPIYIGDEIPGDAVIYLRAIYHTHPVHVCTKSKAFYYYIMIIGLSLFYSIRLSFRDAFPEILCSVVFLFNDVDIV